MWASHCKEEKVNLLGPLGTISEITGNRLLTVTYTEPARCLNPNRVCD
jgi:hypothetical protein